MIPSSYLTGCWYSSSGWEQMAYAGLIGWTAEDRVSSYWLEPVES